MRGFDAGCRSVIFDMHEQCHRKKTKNIGSPKEPFSEQFSEKENIFLV